jgi:hypothetical protein
MKAPLLICGVVLEPRGIAKVGCSGEGGILGMS